MMSYIISIGQHVSVTLDHNQVRNS